MKAPTLAYMQALERELGVLSERELARVQKRRGHFSVFDVDRVRRHREEAAAAFKAQKEYFQLMGLNPMEEA